MGKTLGELEEELAVLENVRLPRLIERIEQKKAEISEIKTQQKKYSTFTEQDIVLLKKFKSLDRDWLTTEEKQESFRTTNEIVSNPNWIFADREKEIAQKLEKELKYKIVAEQMNLSPTRIMQIQAKTRRKIRFIAHKARVY